MGGRNAYCNAVRNFRSHPGGLKVMPALLAGVLPEAFELYLTSRIEIGDQTVREQFKKYF